MRCCVNTETEDRMESMQDSYGIALWSEEQVRQLVDQAGEFIVVRRTLVDGDILEPDVSECPK